MMRVKMILPALTEALSPYFRPIKYSFPPLVLATLAGYLDDGDEVTLPVLETVLAAFGARRPVRARHQNTIIA